LRKELVTGSSLATGSSRWPCAPAGIGPRGFGACKMFPVLRLKASHTQNSDLTVFGSSTSSPNSFSFSLFVWFL
jgi:hypothetical protein